MGRVGHGRVIGLIAVVVFIASVGGASSTARADVEFDIGIGYAHVELDGSASPFDSRGGVRVEPRISWSVDDGPLRLGFGLAFSGYERRVDDDAIFTDDDGDVFEVDSDDVESLTFVTPEFQISYRIPLGPGDFDGNKRWFIEPGVGVGVVIGQYWVGETFGWWVDEDISEWDATIAGRPFLRAGWRGDHWVFGIEGSYLFGGSLDFTNNVGGDVTEWYVGGFVGGHW